MVNKEILKLFNQSTSSIITPLTNIAIVFEENSLGHALLILRESNYTQIPVLNYDKKFIGLISLHQIYKKLGENLFSSFEQLNEYKVKDFVDTHFATLEDPNDLDKILKLLIDYNFINIVSKDNDYLGMITRSSVLKKFNYMAHLSNMDLGLN